MIATWVALAVVASPSPPDDRESKARRALIAGVEAAMEGKRKTARRHLQQVALLAPDVPGVQQALGAAHLANSDLRAAIRVLSRTPAMAAYLAMAHSRRPGGMARARSVLAKHARRDDAPPEVLFLAALAFAAAKQPDRADGLLDRAVRGADGPLDEAFAPDPVVAMTRAALGALEALGGEQDAKGRFAVSLLAADRRAEATRLAKDSLSASRTRAAALRTLIVVQGTSHPRRALEDVQRVLRDEPEAEDLRVAQVILLERLGRTKRARSLVQELGPVDDGALRADLRRAQARLALEAGELDDAIDLAELAVRDDPKSNEAVGLLVEALIAAKKLDRAAAFSRALLRRKPIDVDPFAFLATIDDAGRRAARARTNRLRSEGFAKEKSRLEAVVEAREKVLEAARGAERSQVLLEGLVSVRGEHPELSLPVDIAIARKGTPGHARVARDRILSACRTKLKAFLRKRGAWDAVRISVSPYGKAQVRQAPLSAADPGRCPPARMRAGGRRDARSR